MSISDIIRKTEQRSLVELKDAIMHSVRRGADLLRERALAVQELEKISPLEEAVETYNRLKVENKDDIDVVRFVEKKKRVPKAIKAAYENAKNKIKSYENLDSNLGRVKTDLEVQGAISLDDSLVFVLPVYGEDRVLQQKNLSYDLYGAVGIWFNEQVQKLKDANLTLDDISSTEKDGLIIIAAKPNKETEKAKKSLQNLKGLLFENQSELDLDRLKKANVRFSLYDDKGGYLFKHEISKKKFYTPKEIYSKYSINPASLAWLVKKGVVKPEVREGERYYDADKIDENLTKKQGYSIRDAAKLWKDLEQKLTGKDISLHNYVSRVSDLKARNRINIIESKDTYLVPVKEFENHLYRMSLLYKIEAKKRKLKKGIVREELQGMLNLDNDSMTKLTSEGILKLNKKGKYQLPTIRNFIYTHMYTGNSWVPYR